MSRRIVISINSSWNFINFRAGLVRALAAKGYEVVAVAPRDEYSHRLAALGCRFVPLEMNPHGKSPFGDMRLLFSFWRILRRERPAAFLGYTIKPNIYGSIAAHTLGIPVINNIAGLGETFLRTNWLNLLVRRLYRIALRRSRIVFFQNRDQLASFQREGLVSQDVSRLLPGSGVDLDRFKPSKLRTQSGTNGFAFILISRLLWPKGIEEYVIASRRIRSRHPNVEFRLVGLAEEGQPSAIPKRVLDGWVRERTIDYLASTDDVRPFIAQADCLVLPSYYPEGTPRSLLEGAAMGKPLITSDTAGCRDVVVDGINGMLVPPRDADSLADAMECMLGQSPQQLAAMGRASRKLAEDFYDERVVIDAYFQAIAAVE